jgi:oligoendopeptidase F
MKYATEGGFQQLEPFQEYLKRRKDFLGEEDPEYFDEEGNVIYGGPQ